MTPRRPAWLLCLLTLWWIACPMPARSETQLIPQSLPEKAESTICLTGTEWRQMEAEIAYELETTAKQAADEAVKAAVAPLLADLAGLRVERDGLRAALAAETARADLEARDAATARAWALAGWGTALGAAVAAAVAVLVAVLMK
jgi:hypothetical protein